MNKNKQNLLYRYELIKTDKGMFDNYIDLVYILTTDSNKDHIMDQINKYKPHKKILIQQSINLNFVLNPTHSLLNPNVIRLLLFLLTESTKYG